MENKENKFLKLFLCTFYLSAFTFGGGYVIITLMKKKFVDELGWIDNNEMLDLVAIAQSAPGPIAVNGAIMLGYKIAGWAGVFFSVLGTVLPPFIIISVVSLFYEIFKTNIIVRLMLEGMQSGVGAVIASVVYDMAAGIIKEKSGISMAIMIITFICVYFLNINVMIAIIVCALIGVFRTVFNMRRSK